VLKALSLLNIIPLWFLGLKKTLTAKYSVSVFAWKEDMLSTYK
jgi:hypothetical protein